jgi:TPR repeat protein
MRGGIRPWLGAVCAVAALSATAMAASLEDGNTAYVRGDYPNALEIYRALTEENDQRAEFNLGVMYEKGQGVLQDFAEAASWYLKAADQGYVWAQNNLGVLYQYGRGVPQDLVQAHMWFNLAATYAPASEARNRVLAIRNRAVVTGKMTPAQLAEAQKLAREWKPK